MTAITCFKNEIVTTEIIEIVRGDKAIKSNLLESHNYSLIIDRSSNSHRKNKLKPYCFYKMPKVVCKMTGNMQQINPFTDPVDEKIVKRFLKTTVHQTGSCKHL